MLNGSFLRVCRILCFAKKLDFAFLSLGGHRNQWQEVVGLLFSPPKLSVGAKAQEPVARSRGQWQEVEGLLFSPQNSQLVHILSFCSQGMVSLFIFPICPTALDSEPRGRRYVINMGHNRNHLYSRVIHCPASMEKHYVEWFLLTSVQDIMFC